MRFASRTGERIVSLEDWRTCISAKDWVRGRSAYELASSWLGADGARQAQRALALDPRLADVSLDHGVVEAQTRFDSFGGPRNHDLLAFGRAAGGSCVVSVEAKADETFGQTIRQYRNAARKKVDAKIPTNALTRLQHLLVGICDHRSLEEERVLDLRYQLLSGLAGTVAAARDAQARQAVFLIHEFATSATDEIKRRKNAKDLWHFATTLLDFEVPPAGAWCVGPFTIPGNEHLPADVEIWLAHLTT